MCLRQSIIEKDLMETLLHNPNKKLKIKPYERFLLMASGFLFSKSQTIFTVEFPSYYSIKIEEKDIHATYKHLIIKADPPGEILSQLHNY